MFRTEVNEIENRKINEVKYFVSHKINTIDKLSARLTNRRDDTNK